MSHPVVEAIRDGKAPRPARLATAKGLLPLPPEDLLEALSLLSKESDEEIKAAIPGAMAHFNPDVLTTIAKESTTNPALLSFLCTAPNVPESVHEALIINRSTPDDAVVKFALYTQSTDLIEALTINQQRLIRNPQLIEAVLHNPNRSPEAERRAREVKLEFFEKEYGKQQVTREAEAQSRSTQADAQSTLVVPPPVPVPPSGPLPSVEDVVGILPTPDLPSAPPPSAPAPSAPQKEKKLSSVGPVAMIQQGKAPRPAKLMTAQGKLPLAPDDLLFAQVLLAEDADEEISTAAKASIDAKDPESLLPIAQNKDAPEEVLTYLLLWSKVTPTLGEALLVNSGLSDETVLKFAQVSRNGNLLEAVTINQQRLIRTPGIIDAVLNNPARTPEAERKAREVRVEFFEKELGAKRVAEEKRARAEKFAGIVDTPVSDEEFDAILAEFQADLGVEISDEIPTEEDAIDAFNRMLASVREEEELSRALSDAELSEADRLSIYQKLTRMSTKERIFAALKGNREVRSILIRDSNKLVSGGVLKNPRITDAEVEFIANMKGISEELLRLICLNRAWTAQYNTMHNLVKNPRCPVNFSMQFLPRLQNRDLLNLSKSKGIPDMLRQMAGRLYTKRLAGQG